MSKYTETVNNSKAITDNYTVKKEKIRGITVWMYIPKENKEKDMKETNLEHYKEDLKKILLFNYGNPREAFKIIKETLDGQIKIKIREHHTDAILDWMAQPYEKPILDEAERKYLSDVIRPFRDRVERISKCTNSGMYQIAIYFKDKGLLSLPLFSKETNMYKGMETFKSYSLKELGL